MRTARAPRIAPRAPRVRFPQGDPTRINYHTREDTYKSTGCKKKGGQGDLHSRANPARGTTNTSDRCFWSWSPGQQMRTQQLLSRHSRTHDPHSTHGTSKGTPCTACAPRGHAVHVGCSDPHCIPMNTPSRAPHHHSSLLPSSQEASPPAHDSPDTGFYLEQSES